MPLYDSLVSSWGVWVAVGLADHAGGNLLRLAFEPGRELPAGESCVARLLAGSLCVLRRL
jgi:hypothetical protein